MGDDRRWAPNSLPGRVLPLFPTPIIHSPKGGIGDVQGGPILGVKRPPTPLRCDGVEKNSREFLSPCNPALIWVGGQGGKGQGRGVSAEAPSSPMVLM